jgi:hypothetical protein
MTDNEPRTYKSGGAVSKVDSMSFKSAKSQPSESSESAYVSAQEVLEDEDEVATKHHAKKAKTVKSKQPARKGVITETPVQESERESEEESEFGPTSKRQKDRIAKVKQSEPEPTKQIPTPVKQSEKPAAKQRRTAVQESDKEPVSETEPKRRKDRIAKVKQPEPTPTKTIAKPGKQGEKVAAKQRRTRSGATVQESEIGPKRQKARIAKVKQPEPTPAKKIAKPVKQAEKPATKQRRTRRGTVPESEQDEGVGESTRFADVDLCNRVEGKREHKQPERYSPKQQKPKTKRGKHLVGRGKGAKSSVNPISSDEDDRPPKEPKKRTRRGLYCICVLIPNRFGQRESRNSCRND